MNLTQYADRLRLDESFIREQTSLVDNILGLAPGETLTGLVAQGDYLHDEELRFVAGSVETLIAAYACYCGDQEDRSSLFYWWKTGTLQKPQMLVHREEDFLSWRAHRIGNCWVPPVVVTFAGSGYVLELVQGMTTLMFTLQKPGGETERGAWVVGGEEDLIGLLLGQMGLTVLDGRIVPLFRQSDRRERLQTTLYQYLSAPCFERDSIFAYWTWTIGSGSGLLLFENGTWCFGVHGTLRLVFDELDRNASVYLNFPRLPESVLDGVEESDWDDALSQTFRAQREGLSQTLQERLTLALQS